MHRRWLAGVMVALLSACSADQPEPPPGPTATGASPTPRVQVGTWTALADLPQERTDAGVTVLDGLVYVAGGLGVGGSDAFYQYDPATDAWTELAPLPRPRHHAPLAAYDGKVYLVGGFDNQTSPVYVLGTPTNTVFVYDVASGTWKLGPSLPEPIAAHALATTDDGVIHVFGGLRDDPIRATDTHLALDLSSGAWSSPPPLPSGREHLGAAYLDGVIYVAAGRGGRNGAALEAYHLDREEWTTLPDAPTGRSSVAVVAFQDQVYVLGGETTDGTVAQVERFDPEAATWQEVTPLPQARHGLGAAALADGILAIGGGPTRSLNSSEVSSTTSVEIWRP